MKYIARMEAAWFFLPYESWHFDTIFILDSFMQRKNCEASSIVQKGMQRWIIRWSFYLASTFIFCKSVNNLVASRELHWKVLFMLGSSQRYCALRYFNCSSGESRRKLNFSRGFFRYASNLSIVVETSSMQFACVHILSRTRQPKNSINKWWGNRGWVNMAFSPSCLMTLLTFKDKFLSHIQRDESTAALSAINSSVNCGTVHLYLRHPCRLYSGI